MRLLSDPDERVEAIRTAIQFEERLIADSQDRIRRYRTMLGRLEGGEAE